MFSFLGGEHFDVAVLPGGPREAVGQVDEPRLRELHDQVRILNSKTLSNKNMKRFFTLSSQNLLGVLKNATIEIIFLRKCQCSKIR